MNFCVYVKFSQKLLQNEQIPESRQNRICGLWGLLNTSGASSLMHICKSLKDLQFDHSDWTATVSSDSWGDLPVPPPEVLARGTQSVFRFVRAVLRGGKYISRSCRVMVVGPQMVRAHARFNLLR